MMTDWKLFSIIYLSQQNYSILHITKLALQRNSFANELHVVAHTYYNGLLLNMVENVVRNQLSEEGLSKECLNNTEEKHPVALQT
jgi:hypothetical protein